MSSVAEYRTYLQDYLMRYHNITNPKKAFHCLNPEHPDNNPSMVFTNKYNICKCFSCGISYDIFDLIGMDFNINNFKDKISKVEELYLGITPKYEEYHPENHGTHDYTNYYNICVKNSNKSDYLEKRGITKDIIKKYKIGYDNKRNLVIFPINKYCYFGRSTIDDWKVKNPGGSDVWNKELLDQNDIIYVTEGIIDSLSLEVIDPSVKTLSINGAGNIPSFLYAIKNKNFKGIIAIVFDNDFRGKQESEHLKEELKKLNINSVSLTLPPSGCKDINEALISNVDGLKKKYNQINDCLKIKLKSINDTEINKDEEKEL